jgi:hypothetical protein
MNTKTIKYTARENVVHIYLSTVHEMNTIVSTSISMSMSRNMDTDVFIYILHRHGHKKDIARAQKEAVVRSNSYFNALRNHKHYKAQQEKR